MTAPTEKPLFPYAIRLVVIVGLVVIAWKIHKHSFSTGFKDGFRTCTQRLVDEYHQELKK